MQKFSLLLIALFVQVSVWAQAGEKALVQVNYQFTHIHDTLHPDLPIKEEMVLYIGRQSSIYGSYELDRIAQDLKRQVQSIGFDGNLVLKSNRNVSQEAFLTNYGKRELQLIYSGMGGYFVLDEVYPEIDWEILDETALIDGFGTQKARGSFGGRIYEAWFTTELPIQGAPWKLHGLPGLVLKARSVDGDVNFDFISLNTNLQSEIQISLPFNGIKTTKKELDRTIEAIKKNPSAAAKAALSGRTTFGGGSSFYSRSLDPLSTIDASRIKSVNVQREGPIVSKDINNPLEKSKNK